MIALRRSGERHYLQQQKQEGWHTFQGSDGTAPFSSGFGPLERLGECRLPPGISLRPDEVGAGQLLTYVRSGALAQNGSDGSPLALCAGEFQRRNCGAGPRYRARNASRSEWAHLFQMRLRLSQPGRDPGSEQKRFSAADRRGAFCIVASPDGRKGSLHLQGGVLYTALLAPGQHVIHELAPEQAAWLHVVIGEVTLGEVLLKTGDAAGVCGERAVSITARQVSEVLLLDFG